VRCGQLVLPQNSPAQTQDRNAVIDLHHHFYAPPLKKFVDAVPSIRAMLDYVPEKSIAAMDQAGVTASLLSARLWLGDNPSNKLSDLNAASRETNEYGAKLVSDHKGRFGLFAMLPLPDVNSSLREIEYSFEKLNVDGVAVLTSYGNRWLGDKFFQPVFDELNRRDAVVHIHPTDGPCCHHTLPDTGPERIEWPTDSARAIWSMIDEGRPGSPRQSMATRYGNVRFIWSHAGGTLLGLVSRFLDDAASAENLAKSPELNSRLYHLRRFYYDTAGSANPIQMQALKRLVGGSQIVFGSDFPFGPLAKRLEQLQGCGFSANELRAIHRDNGLRILPRLC
jgi:predicted TIM-barrel fold metal-dependent hydrolase